MASTPDTSAAAAAAAAAAANTSLLPASILLDEHVHVSDRINGETLAKVKSKDGHTIELSFWIHKPPALSYFSHKDADFEDWPEVVGAEGRFVLFRASFASNSGRDEYFMYKAADGESGGLTSLDPVLLPDGYRLPRLLEFGIVPRGDGGHYLVAALCLHKGPLNYRLQIYSSEDKTWTSILLNNPCPEVSKVITSKVIKLGEGLIGWVDLHHGMLVCDFRQGTINADAPPSALYIPLPDPLPGNSDQLEALEPGLSTRRFRDLICIDGTIKFIELEHRVIVIPEKPSDPSEKDMLFDSDLIKSRKRKDVYEKPKQLCKRDGWRVVMWSRKISCNSWHKRCVVDVADVLDTESMYFAPSRLRGETVVENLGFRDLYSVFPTLSLDDDDVLYLKSKTKCSDSGGQIVAVDLGKKMVKAHVPYSFATHEPYMRAHRPCALPHLSNMTPGMRVSAYCQMMPTWSSINDPNNTSPDPFKSDSKRSRLSAERVNHAQNGAQSTVQNISRVRPVQNNMPPQQQFTKWYRHCYPGTPWPHQNNLPPQQFFNKWVGPCNPRRALLAPLPILHGCGNHQPLWQQSPLSKQRLMPTVMFWPHEASQQHFKKCDGTSYHGYSQQFPSYGTHLDNLNYQRWWELHQVEELPTVAAPQWPPLLQHQLCFQPADT